MSPAEEMETITGDQKRQIETTIGDQQQQTSHVERQISPVKDRERQMSPAKEVESITEDQERQIESTTGDRQQHIDQYEDKISLESPVESTVGRTLEQISRFKEDMGLESPIERPGQISSVEQVETLIKHPGQVESTTGDQKGQISQIEAVETSLKHPGHVEEVESKIGEQHPSEVEIEKSGLIEPPSPTSKAIGELAPTESKIADSTSAIHEEIATSMSLDQPKTQGKLNTKHLFNSL
jgi:hypothetical protein